MRISDWSSDVCSSDLPVFVTAWIRDETGQPVPDAEVDIWHASADGYYENQDPEQADMNLRGKFRTDADGCVRFRTVKPAGYPIPVGGPVGALIRAQGRHNMRQIGRASCRERVCPYV